MEKTAFLLFPFQQKDPEVYFFFFEEVKQANK